MSYLGIDFKLSIYVKSSLDADGPCVIGAAFF